MRTFIAVEIPQELRDRLSAVAGELAAGLAEQSAASVLRWTAQSNYHLTLRFLGDTTPVQREAIGKILERTTADHSPFSLTLEGLGAFPNWRKMRVLWVGMIGEIQRLTDLQREVETGVQACGFAVERQGFHPHATLAYVNKDAQSGLIAQAGRFLAAQQKLAQGLGQWQVSELTLMRSELRPTGSVYTVLERFGLAG
ncbi:MAG: RNA 2',3'-cyclic phosphodiesterase [Chloroflexi bacterium]|nr:MAG: RNA 2',3'-cyclic phosphodiesterase [Chloroflexota bacterium]